MHHVRFTFTTPSGVRQAVAGDQTVVRLPSRWRIARDAGGRAYYYNAETNETQWEPPWEDMADPDDEADPDDDDDDAAADITIVEMEVEASDGEQNFCHKSF